MFAVTFTWQPIANFSVIAVYLLSEGSEQQTIDKFQRGRVGGIRGYPYHISPFAYFFLLLARKSILIIIIRIININTIFFGSIIDIILVISILPSPSPPLSLSSNPFAIFFFFFGSQDPRVTELL